MLEAALGASSLSWSLVQPALSQRTRVCSYDRAGMGWSDPGHLPRTAGRIADELHALLAVTRTAPPYVLVGHSFGGLVMQIFAHRHPQDVVGLVLVDPAHAEDWVHPAPKEQAKIDRGVRLCFYGQRASRLGVARLIASLVAIGALPAARLLAKLVSRGGITREDEGIVAPIWRLPPEARRPLRHLWTRPGFFEALGSQIGSIRTSAAETLVATSRGFGNLPLVTISSTDPGGYRLRQQDALARLSTRGRHIVASRSGHWIPLDEPETVIRTVSELLDTLGRPATAHDPASTPV